MFPWQIRSLFTIQVLAANLVRSKASALTGDTVAGLVPHSLPNVLAAGLVSDLTQTLTVTFSPVGYISIPDDSNLKSFDLESFYFGCDEVINYSFACLLTQQIS